MPSCRKWPVKFYSNQFPREKGDGRASSSAVPGGPRTRRHWEKLGERDLGAGQSLHWDVALRHPESSFRVSISFRRYGGRCQAGSPTAFQTMCFDVGMKDFYVCRVGSGKWRVTSVISLAEFFLHIPPTPGI